MTLVDNPWDLFPKHEHLGTEECGNEIVVDTGGTLQPVFAMWHDPPEVLILCRSATEFHKQVPNFAATGHVSDQMQQFVDTLWTGGDGHLLSLEQARTQIGEHVAGWLDTLPEQSLIADLRAAEPGSGFTWCLDDTFSRCPGALIFARVRSPRLGFFKRLFGR
jgi:hypothetical protein